MRHSQTSAGRGLRSKQLMATGECSHTPHSVMVAKPEPQVTATHGTGAKGASVILGIEVLAVDRLGAGRAQGVSEASVTLRVVPIRAVVHA